MVTRSWCQSTKSAIHDHVNTIPLIKEVLYMIMLTLHLWSSSRARLTVSSPQGVPYHRRNQFQPSLHSFSANQSGLTIILNEPNSSKKVLDASFCRIFPLFSRSYQNVVTDRMEDQRSLANDLSSQTHRRKFVTHLFAEPFHCFHVYIKTW